MRTGAVHRVVELNEGEAALLLSVGQLRLEPAVLLGTGIEIGSIAPLEVVIRIGRRLVGQPVAGVERDQGDRAVVDPVVPPAMLRISGAIGGRLEVREELVRGELRSFRRIAAARTGEVLMISDRGKDRHAAGQRAVVPRDVPPEFVPIALLAAGFREVAGDRDEIRAPRENHLQVLAKARGLIGDIPRDSRRPVAAGRGRPLDRRAGRRFRLGFGIGNRDESDRLAVVRRRPETIPVLRRPLADAIGICRSRFQAGHADAVKPGEAAMRASGLGLEGIVRQGLRQLRLRA